MREAAIGSLIAKGSEPYPHTGQFSPFQNPDFLPKHPDFLSRNPDFLLKTVEFIIKIQSRAGIGSRCAALSGRTRVSILYFY